jgi:quinol monooxygenase YgiN
MTPEIEIVRMSVDPDRAAELVRALEQARAGFLAPPSCEEIRLLLAEERDEVVAIITWSSSEAHDRALQAPAAESFFRALGQLTAGPPSVGRYASAGS